MSDRLVNSGIQRDGNIKVNQSPCVGDNYKMANHFKHLGRILKKNDGNRATKEIKLRITAIATELSGTS